MYPKKAFEVYLVSQRHRIFRAGENAFAAGDALIRVIAERSLTPFFAGLQGPGRTVDLAGGTPRAALMINPRPAKEKYNHQEHGFARKYMDGKQVFPQE